LPEIWINIARKTKIKELEITTREVPNYDLLMKKRLKILRERGIGLREIQKIIKPLQPLKGAINFLNSLRKKFPVIILTDSFYEFLFPLIPKLFYPTIFCNSLKIDEKGMIKDYYLRLKNGKAEAVVGLRRLGFEVVAVGDSYNDLEMLKRANKGILFRPPQNIIKENPGFPIAKNYADLQKSFIVPLLGF